MAKDFNEKRRDLVQTLLIVGGIFGGFVSSSTLNVFTPYTSVFLIFLVLFLVFAIFDYSFLMSDRFAQSSMILIFSPMVALSFSALLATAYYAVVKDFNPALIIEIFGGILLSLSLIVDWDNFPKRKHETKVKIPDQNTEIRESSAVSSMSNDTSDLEKLKIFMRLQQNEVRYHWTRNNYFLLMSSILLVALVQVKSEILQLFIGLVGFSLSSVWFLIQLNSNRYIKYWNKQMGEFGTKVGLPSFYSHEGFRIPIRIIVLVLPIPFLVLWLLAIFLAAYGVNL